MNRGFGRFFHLTADSSFRFAVEDLWILCQTRPDCAQSPALTLFSGVPRSDFSHEGSIWN